MESQVDWEALRMHAVDACKKAYCPYSLFPVGAAVLAVDGRIFCGCNVENSSYGATICAERTAIFSAISQGAQKIKAVVIYTPTTVPAASCGLCRQVISEFGSDIEVRSFCDGQEVLCLSIGELLPYPFDVKQISQTEDSTPQRKQQTKRLCVDLDNVVIATDSVMRKVIHEFTDGHVDLSYHDIKVFDYHKCVDSNGHSITHEQWQVIHHDWFSRAKYQELMEPIQGAMENLHKLSEVFEIHFATARPEKMRGSTIEWLRKHGVAGYDLHFLRQGEKHNSLGSFFASVEDNLHQAQEFAASGVVSYLLAHPWNVCGINDSLTLWRLNDWGLISDHLLKYAEESFVCRSPNQLS